MRHWATGIVGSAMVGLLLAGCGTARVEPAAHSAPGTNPVAPRESSDPPPAGWRWESFRGIEAAVPDAWEVGSSTGQLTTQWCVGKRAEGSPTVGRPGASTDVGCDQSDDGGDPSVLIENAGTFLAFDDYTDAPDGTVSSGDRTTVTLNGVSVLVQATADLRAEIVSTIHAADPDFNGCPATHPISQDPARRPDHPVDVASITGVTAVAACRYEIEDLDSERPTGLFSSVLLTGDAAQASVEGIAGAPAGGGPDSPENCLPEVFYGSEVIVLLIDSDLGRSEIYLRYSGCDHHGFDDGVTVRTLTAASVAPFITGDNAVDSAEGQGMADILFPGER